MTQSPRAGAAKAYALCDIGFQGLMHDEVTGNIYQRAREYSPRLARFMQRDPLGYPDGMNTYAAYHVLYGRFDPWGLSPDWSEGAYVDPRDASWRQLQDPAFVSRMKREAIERSRYHWNQAVENGDVYRDENGDWVWRNEQARDTQWYYHKMARYYMDLQFTLGIVYSESPEEHYWEHEIAAPVSDDYAANLARTGCPVQSGLDTFGENCPLVEVGWRVGEAATGKRKGGVNHGQPLTPTERVVTVAEGTLVAAGPATRGFFASFRALRRMKKGNPPNGNPAPCFTAGTPVLTEDGTKPIEEVETDERVWSYNTESKAWELKRVVETFVHDYTGDIITITVRDQAIEATGNHPFWVVAGQGLAERHPAEHIETHEQAMTEHGRWVDARHLQVGDSVLLRSGEAVAIDSISVAHGKATVYNFHVEGTHTYAVGTDGVLVHNRAMRADASDVPERLPSNARTTRDPQEVYRRLEKYHGISRHDASERLHDIKQDLGIAPDADLDFDLTGNVYDPETGDWLGSLTEGGGSK